MSHIFRRLGFAALLVLFVITPALARDVGIAWDANPEPEVAGYIVRYGTVPGAYDASIDVGNRTTWTLTALGSLTKYYVAVEAYSADGLRSELSTEIIIERETVPCSSTLSTTSASIGAGGGETTVVVTTSPDCVWNATSLADWIVISPASQTGSSTVALSIANNPAYGARTGRVTIAGKTVLISQSASVPVSLTKLTPDLALPMFAGKTVTWTAASTGGASVLYQFVLYDDFTGNWTLVQDYSATQTFTWTPAKPGRYSVQVRAKDQNSSLPYASQLASGLFDVNSAKPEALTLTSSTPFPIVTATSVTWTARSRGGIGPIQYQFWVYDGQATRWTMTQDYGAGNTFAWTPARPGTYAFQVWARSAGSIEAYEVYRGSGYVQVTAGPVKLLAINADRLLPSPEEVPLTWTAIGSGGTGALEYQVPGSTPAFPASGRCCATGTPRRRWPGRHLSPARMPFRRGFGPSDHRSPTRRTKGPGISRSRRAQRDSPNSRPIRHSRFRQRRRSSSREMPREAAPRSSISSGATAMVAGHSDRTMVPRTRTRGRRHRATWDSAPCRYGSGVRGPASPMRRPSGPATL